MLTAAEKDFCSLFRLVFDRRKRRVLMRAVAKWLILTFSARAPEICFARVNINWNWSSLSDNWTIHNYKLLFCSSIDRREQPYLVAA